MKKGLDLTKDRSKHLLSHTARLRDKSRGFTLVEIVVSGLILVVAITLIGVLFGKAGRIRTAVTAENDIQTAANQMMDTILYGAGSPLEGLLSATEIYQIDTAYDPPRYIAFGNGTSSSNNYVRFDINLLATGETLYKNTASISGSIPGPWGTSILDFGTNLDLNDKVDLQSGSGFYCYGSDEVSTTAPSEVAKVMVCLVARSSLAAISRTITLYNSVKIRNLYDID